MKITDDLIEQLMIDVSTGKKRYVKFIDGDAKGSTGEVVEWTHEYHMTTWEEHLKHNSTTCTAKATNTYLRSEPKTTHVAMGGPGSLFSKCSFIRWVNITVNFSASKKLHKKFSLGREYPIEIINDGSVQPYQIHYMDSATRKICDEYGCDIIGTQVLVGDIVAYVNSYYQMEFGRVHELLPSPGNKTTKPNVKIILHNGHATNSAKCLKVDSNISENLVTYFLSNSLTF